MDSGFKCTIVSLLVWAKPLEKTPLVFSIFLVVKVGTACIFVPGSRDDSRFNLSGCIMEIAGFEAYSNIIPVEQGWSGDKKYCVINGYGVKYFLRISPSARYEERKALYKMLQQVSTLGIPMCRPVEFGSCPGGVYALHSWVEGEDMAVALPALPGDRQYELGVEAGRILRDIHTLPAPAGWEDWESRFNRKMDSKIKLYRDCPIQMDGAAQLIEYMESNRRLLKGRPQCFQHGDYQIGNMMLENGELIIIDFDRFDFGDPWEEFSRIVWCALASSYLASGLVDGYFGGPPPEKFWKLLALYISTNTLSSVPWAIPFGQAEVDTMLNQARQVLSWYDNMRTIVPPWYGEGMCKARPR